MGVIFFLLFFLGGGDGAVEPGGEGSILESCRIHTGRATSGQHPPCPDGRPRPAEPPPGGLLQKTLGLMSEKGLQRAGRLGRGSELGGRSLPCWLAGAEPGAPGDPASPLRLRWVLEGAVLSSCHESLVSGSQLGPRFLHRRPQGLAKAMASAEGGGQRGHQACMGPGPEEVSWRVAPRGAPGLVRGEEGVLWAAETCRGGSARRCRPGCGGAGGTDRRHREEVGASDEALPSDARDVRGSSWFCF